MSELPPPSLPEPPSSAVEPAPAEESHEVPWWGPVTLVCFVGLVVATNVANAVWARWVSSDPEQLLLLSSRNRYLALTLAADVSLVTFGLIAILRISAAFTVCHLIGRAYSYQAIGWFKKYLGFNDESERAFNRGFDRAEWLLVPIFVGSNIVAALTGVRKTPPVKLVPLLIIGIIGRLILIWWLARTFEDQLVDLLEWIARYQWWVVAGSIGLVALVNIKNFRRG